MKSEKSGKLPPHVARVFIGEGSCFQASSVLRGRGSAPRPEGPRKGLLEGAGGCWGGG